MSRLTYAEIRDAILRAAITTIEAHRPATREAISQDAVHAFLVAMAAGDTAVIGEFVGEALAESMDDVTRAHIAALVRTGDTAEIGRIAAKAITDYASNVLSSHWEEMYT
jgi:hypothetical protein